MFEYDSIRDFLKSFFSSRLFVLTVILLLMSGIILQRLFSLQIINGETYQKNYTLKIKKTRTLSGTRGNIYDRNGMLLAYNELAYKVTIEDNGTYEDSSERDETLNGIIAEVMEILDKNNDGFINNFDIQLKKNGKYVFRSEGTSLMRFRADVYGYQKIEDLEYDDDLGYDTAKATEKQIVDYLFRRYELDESDYSQEMKYNIMIVRYALAQNGFQKYISTTIATGVSKKTIAYIRENKDRLQGVEIEEDYIRKYTNSKYFASMIGYTGKISTTEYEELSAKNDSYSLTDIIGKSGIESVMDEQLQGKKGSETVFVDNMGKERETTNYIEPSAGNNVYLSIDGKLQKAVYDLIEQELAGILYNNILNIREFVNVSGEASDIKIPIYDVYFALINNSIIDTSHFQERGASDTEKSVLAAFQTRLESVLERIR